MSDPRFPTSAAGPASRSGSLWPSRRCLPAFSRRRRGSTRSPIWTMRGSARPPTTRVVTTTESTITELKDQQELARIALVQTAKERDLFLSLKEAPALPAFFAGTWWELPATSAIRIRSGRRTASGERRLRSGAGAAGAALAAAFPLDWSEFDFLRSQVVTSSAQTSESMGKSGNRSQIVTGYA